MATQEVARSLPRMCVQLNIAMPRAGDRFDVCFTAPSPDKPKSMFARDYLVVLGQQDPCRYFRALGKSHRLEPMPEQNTGCAIRKSTPSDFHDTVVRRDQYRSGDRPMCR